MFDDQVAIVIGLHSQGMVSQAKDTLNNNCYDFDGCRGRMV